MNRNHPRRRRHGAPTLYVAGGQTVPADDPTPTGIIDLGPAPFEMARAQAAVSATPEQIETAADLGTVRQPDLLAGAVRAELLADDWRADIRAQVQQMQDQAAAEWNTAAAIDRHEQLADELVRTAEELDAEAATEQGDDHDPLAEDDLGESLGDAPVGPGGGEWAEVEAASDADFDDPAPPTDTLGRVHDWTSRHDDRSLEYGVRAHLNGRTPLQDRVWPHGPIFDQGSAPPLAPKDASGCTGYALAAALNALGLDLTADEAFELYLGAQRRDHVPGESYPGSSVLAAAQEAKALGLIDGFLWGFGVGDIAQSLLHAPKPGAPKFGPVVLGIPWLDQMAVDSDGVLTPAGERGGMGHAIASIGLLLEHAGRRGPWFVLQQSYGPAVGVGGLLYLHVDHLRLLLRGVGEACVPIIAPKE